MISARRLLVALTLLMGLSAIAPAFAQAPPAVPSLPDTERRTAYSISTSTCACAVNFALYGDSTDYQSWVEVYLNGVQVQYNDPVYGWTITSNTGPLATIPRPITDAVLTFNSAQTGTVQIVGARRPRQPSQFTEGRGVAARDLNQRFTDVSAIEREIWDKINDVTGRSLISQPGNTVGMLPLPSACINSYLTFDSTGLKPICLPLQTAVVSALSVGQTSVNNGTNGCALYDNAGTLGCSSSGTGVAVGTTAVTGSGVANGCQLYNNNGVVGCGGRIALTSNTVFYVNPGSSGNNCNGSSAGASGSDSTGTGTLALPWASVAHAYSKLQSSYDLSSGDSVNIVVCDGTYTKSTQLQGSIVGQVAAGQVIIQGDCTTPGNTLVQPLAGLGYTFSAAYGAQYRLMCFELDESNNANTTGPYPDIVTVGQASKILLGDPALFGSGADLHFGCNFSSGNTTSVEFGGYLEFDNDFIVDGGICQKNYTGTLTTSSASITGMSSTAGLAPGMNVIASGVPTSAYIQSISGSTVVFTCASAIPTCSASSTGSASISFTGGGQAFLDMGNGTTAYFSTNGDPSYSIIATLTNFPIYTSGFFFINDNSGVNAQAITFVNPTQAYGRCSTAKNYSTLDTNSQGVPYLPCLNGINSSLNPQITGTLTAGSNTITVSASTGIKVGQLVSGISIPTASFTAGSAVVTVSSTTNLAAGQHVIPSTTGILAGSTIGSVGSGTITLTGCGSGPRCQSGTPVFASQSSVQIWITGIGLPNDTVVTGVNGTTITLSQAATISGSIGLLFQGQMQPWYGGIYD